MRAEADAEPAVDADHGLVDLVIPVDRPDETGLPAVSASDTALHVQGHAAARPQNEGIGGAHPGAGGILAGPADDDGESPFHAPDGPDADTGFRQAPFVLSSRACEHAALTAYAFFRFKDGEPHGILFTQIFFRFRGTGSVEGTGMTVRGNVPFAESPCLSMARKNYTMIVLSCPTGRSGAGTKGG